MSGALFFISLMGWALLFMLLIPALKTGAALMVSLCTMLFAAYYGVIIMGLMRPTAYVVIIGGLAAFAAGLWATLRNVRKLRLRLLSPALLFYGLACVFIAWSAGGLLFSDHDAYSFWARAVKELYTFDRFYIHGEVNMYHMDYIPLLASLQYAIVQVFGWQDAFLTYVPAACMVVCIAAMADLLPGWRKSLCFCLLGVYAYIAFGFPILYMRADGPMLLLFTAGAVCLSFRRDDCFASLFPTLCAAMILPGLKIYSGLMFAAVLAIGLGCEWLLAHRAHRPAQILGITCLVSIGLIAALQVSWSVLFHYTSAVAAAESAAARAAYLGNAASDTAATVSLNTLLSGNYRTQALFHSFTPENIRQFLQLADNTITGYVDSKLKGAPLFVLLGAVPVWLCSRKTRSRYLKTVFYLLIAGMVYLLGLFASYFVQAETAPAAVHYLATVSTPFLMAVLFSTLFAMRGKAKWPAALMLAAMTGLLVFFLPPEQMVFEHHDDQYTDAPALAYDFYTNELEGLITEADAGKSALLVDSTEAASQLTSRSFKTHAYQYFGLPLRVAEPTYLPYGAEDAQGYATQTHLYERLKYIRSDLLILRIEDENHWQAVCGALGLDPETDCPIGVYEVTYQNGQFSFAMRSASSK